MASEDGFSEATAATVEFERDLESLLLTAFADGALVEGSWDVELPVSSAPNWTVEISKRSPDEAVQHEPEFVDD
ncbi:MULTISPECIES: hypothetical protein [Halorussus]|uniref:hypothetical protein n=1 Tax=Halorussus TaxID=1070314 RepID=UPI0020A176FD|nr:hypothetical protein [Halorussus vallis]USZ75276.1 hypothetical protein NGM07_17815 [Halorussus vallis]